MNHNLIAVSYTACKQSQMYCGSTSRKCHDLFVFSDKLFEALFKSIDIRAQRHHPVSIESLFYVFLFVALFAHVGETEVNSFTFSFHNIILLIDIQQFTISIQFNILFSTAAIKMLLRQTICLQRYKKNCFRF